jgi:transcriptional regulator with XRE-family HTH domain
VRVKTFLLGSKFERQQKIAKIERGQHLPNLALILKLAVALSTTPGDLVDRAALRLSEDIRAPD